VSLRYDTRGLSHMLRCDYPACPALYWCGHYGMDRIKYQVDAWVEGWRRRWHGNTPRDLCPAHAAEE
jgi:hypothetical protein